MPLYCCLGAKYKFQCIFRNVCNNILQLPVHMKVKIYFHWSGDVGLNRNPVVPWIQKFILTGTYACLLVLHSIQFHCGYISFLGLSKKALPCFSFMLGMCPFHYLQRLCPFSFSFMNFSSLSKYLPVFFPVAKTFVFCF